MLGNTGNHSLVDGTMTLRKQNIQTPYKLFDNTANTIFTDNGQLFKDNFKFYGIPFYF